MLHLAWTRPDLSEVNDESAGELTDTSYNDLLVVQRDILFLR